MRFNSVSEPAPSMPYFYKDLVKNTKQLQRRYNRDMLKEKPRFSKRKPTELTVKGLQEKFPDIVSDVTSYNNGKVAVTIPNGRIIFDSRHK